VGNRGKLRNQLFPLLEEIYGKGFLDNLTNLAKDSTSLREMVHKEFFEPFWGSITYSDVGFWFDFDKYRTKPYIFWKEAFRHIFHSLGLSVVRDKGLKHFLNRLNHRRDCWIILKKENPSYLQKTILFVFHDGFLTKVPYAPKGAEIKVNTTTTFTYWIITTEIVPDKVSTCSLETKRYGKVFSWFDLMTGSLVYSLPLFDDSSFVISPQSELFEFCKLEKSLRASLPIVDYKITPDPVPTNQQTTNEPTSPPIKQPTTWLKITLNWKRNPRQDTLQLNDE